MLTSSSPSYSSLCSGLQEASLMGKVIGNSGQFELWLRDFLPSLFNEDFELEPGEVIDRYVFTVHQNGFD